MEQAGLGLLHGLSYCDKTFCTGVLPGNKRSQAMNQQTDRFNHLFTIVFAVLLALQVLYLLVGIASIPIYYQRVTAQTIEPVIYYGQVQLSNTIVEQMASERGLSLGQYASYRTAAGLVAVLIPLALAIVIVWRSGWNWFAWFTAFVIVFLCERSLQEQMLAARLIPLEVYGAYAIFWFLLLPYLFLFPNGRAVPQRAGWVVGALVAYHAFIQVGTVTAYIAPELALRFNMPNWGQSQYIWPVLFNFLIILICQIIRFRRVSTVSERQQTKWFLYGFGIVVALIPVSAVLDGLKISGYLKDATDYLLWMPFYVGLAIAVLRYRLFDIDVIIRKTLLYSVLTALLALVYFGSVVLLQVMFSRVAGVQQSTLAVVISTLVIAALFTPLRRRIQDWIDRRFYRKKYDAQQVLAELVRVVDETLQPEHVSVWLRETKSRS
ncbi:MAG TPA: hypothetical protein VL334_01890 [Anaerolineae bacterium]|nr:hypothetical protein [Anaerolineae bacterium]